MPRFEDKTKTSQTALAVEGVSAGYGSVAVLRDVNLLVAPGEIVAVLGRNGAGKTTLLKSVMGIVKPSQGRIIFEGDGDLAGMTSDAIAHRGVGYAPQGRAIFPALTVLENLRVAQYACRATKSAVDEVIELFPAIKAHLDQRGGSLSGGQQQIVALARALVASPKLLLLDEPSEGIQPSIVDTIIDCLINIQQKRSLAVLLVEQNLDFAVALSNRAYLMELGRIARVLRKAELADADQLARELMITT